MLYRLRDLGDALKDQDRSDLAAAFQESVVGSLLEKLALALAERTVEQVVVCGGVAANSLLRERAAEVVAAAGARLTIPPLVLCTDNGAMIAAAAHHAPQAALEVDPNLGW